MFKVEASLKEIATRQLSQRRARKEGEPRRPVTTVKELPARLYRREPAPHRLFFSNPVASPVHAT